MTKIMVYNVDEKIRIVEAAREKFAIYGYKKTTIEDIAKNAGKAKATIYYYFKGKEEIFRDVVLLELNFMISKLKLAIDISKTAPLKLKNYIRTRLKFFRLLTNFYGIIYHDYPYYPGFVEEIRKNYSQQETDLIEEILKDGIRENTFHIDNTPLAARAIRTSLRGLEIPIILNEKENDFGRLVDELIRIFLKGIEKSN